MQLNTLPANGVSLEHIKAATRQVRKMRKQEIRLYYADLLNAHFHSCVGLSCLLAILLKYALEGAVMATGSVIPVVVNYLDAALP